MLRCTVGVLAYNEEKNISQILHSLLNQQLASVQIVEIVVVASGCTDRTVALAEQIACEYPIVNVYAQPERAGKAAAINCLIQRAQGEIVVLAGADTLPDPTAIEHLLQPFEDPTVGMTGARIVPLNDPRTFLGFAIQMLWQTHHQMALRWPKLGEMVAFRNVIDALPVRTATDEVAIEALITAQGYRLAYAPAAIVYNLGPQTLHDFLLQRRRIFAGHLHIAATQRYVAASMPFTHLLALARESVVSHHRWMLWLMATILLECWARVLGVLDFLIGHRHHIWRPIRSTKQMQPPAQRLTLVSMKYPPGNVRRADIMRSLHRIPTSLGALFWWDHHGKELLFLISPESLSQPALDQHIINLVAYIDPKKNTASHNLAPYRVIEFASPLPSEDEQGRYFVSPTELDARPARRAS